MVNVLDFMTISTCIEYVRYMYMYVDYQQVTYRYIIYGNMYNLV